MFALCVANGTRPLTREVVETLLMLADRSKPGACCCGPGILKAEKEQSSESGREGTDWRSRRLGRWAHLGFREVESALSLSGSRFITGPPGATLLPTLLQNVKHWAATQHKLDLSSTLAGRWTRASFPRTSSRLFDQFKHFFSMSSTLGIHDTVHVTIRLVMLSEKLQAF